MTQIALERSDKTIAITTNQVAKSIRVIRNIKARVIHRFSYGKLVQIRRCVATPAPCLMTCDPKPALGGEIPAKNAVPIQEQFVAHPATASPILPTLGFPGVSKACGSKAAEIIRQSAVQNVSNPRKWFPKEQ
mmetsp:Transcript_10106/g.14594  ORF Transcript_10106/g.14594 Transcript_10106/m.14594 type:complete len:133 (+) Transcript_10106:526-924(+)